MTPTLHASAVLVGARAVLIRGPAGAGKSSLALRLVLDRGHPFARLIADDRTVVMASSGRLLARAAETIAGLIEVRGLGIRRLAHEPAAVIGLVVDLGDRAAERMPAPEAQAVTIEGVVVPRVAVPPGCDPLPAVLAALAQLPPA